MGDMLVDDPQPVFVHRKNERVANLTQRPERAESRQRRLFVPCVFLSFKFRSASIVGNRFVEVGLESSSHRNRSVRLDSNSTLELEPGRRQRWNRRLQTKAGS